MWNQKNNTNESLFKTETQRHRNQTHGYQKGAFQNEEGVTYQEYGVNRSTLLYIK